MKKSVQPFSGATDKIKVDSSTVKDVSKRVSGVSEKLKGTVKGVPVKSDELSNKIDQIYGRRKYQIIKDWELATKNDFTRLENRSNKLSTDVNTLNTNFDEYRDSTNKKIKNIEERLDKLENTEK